MELLFLLEILSISISAHMDFMLILWYNVIVHGADLVSTGSVEYGWQVECSRHGHKKINATKLNFCNTNIVRAVRRVGLEHSD